MGIKPWLEEGKEAPTLFGKSFGKEVCLKKGIGKEWKGAKKR